MVEYDVQYEVWSERDGVVTRRQMLSTSKPEPSQRKADDWNEEERDNARAEMRPVRTRFFVAKVVTSYEEVQS